ESSESNESSRSSSSSSNSSTSRSSSSDLSSPMARVDVPVTKPHTSPEVVVILDPPQGDVDTSSDVPLDARLFIASTVKYRDLPKIRRISVLWATSLVPQGPGKTSSFLSKPLATDLVPTKWSFHKPTLKRFGSPFWDKNFIENVLTDHWFSHLKRRRSDKGKEVEVEQVEVEQSDDEVGAVVAKKPILLFSWGSMLSAIFPLRRLISRPSALAYATSAWTEPEKK
ncbi:hypothetical protein Salat_2119600, partial [Sesamum alatum]